MSIFSKSNGASINYAIVQHDWYQAQLNPYIYIYCVGFFPLNQGVTHPPLSKWWKRHNMIVGSLGRMIIFEVVCKHAVKAP
jgi:hypothetical protein